MLPAWRISSRSAQWLMTGSPGVLAFGSQKLVGSHPPSAWTKTKSLPRWPAAWTRGRRKPAGRARGQRTHEETATLHSSSPPTGTGNGSP